MLRVSACQACDISQVHPSPRRPALPQHTHGFWVNVYGESGALISKRRSMDKEIHFGLYKLTMQDVARTFSISRRVAIAHMRLA